MKIKLKIGQSAAKPNGGISFGRFNDYPNLGVHSSEWKHEDRNLFPIRYSLICMVTYSGKFNSYGYGLTTHIEQNDFKNVKATQTRGNMTAGEDVLDPRVFTKTPQGYASNQIIADEAATVSSAVTAGSTAQVSATLEAKPVLAQSVRLSISGSSTHYGIDDGAGRILGAGMTGTIEYETGKLELTVVGEIAANAKLQAVYQTNLEVADDIAQVQSEFATKQVKARVYALKSTIGMLQAYSMQKRFGMIAEDEAAKDLISEINAELGGDLVRVINAATPNKAAPLKWDRRAPNGVSVFEHRMSLMDALAMMDKNIATAAGRGSANIYIAGSTACAVMQNLPNFKLITDSTQIGPHVFGTLGGKTVVRVVDPSVLPANEILGVYKGQSPSREYLKDTHSVPLYAKVA